MISFLLIFNIQTVSSQNWNEWFKQKKTQRKYLIEQIAGLQVYLDYTRKGYGLVKDGTALIGDIRNGDFNLHNDYFSGKRTVDPAIKQSDKVKDAIRMQAWMVADRAAMLKLVDGTNVIAGAELSGVKKIYAGFTEEAVKCIDELKLLIEDGKLELSDDERIKRIDKLYAQMRSNYSDQSRFSAKIKSLIESRKAQLREIELLKRLYGQ